MLYFPYPNIERSYNCLSEKDKATQLPAAYIILKTIKQKQLVEMLGVDTKKGTIAFARDPAVLMFQPYESYLVLYINTICLLEGKMPNLSFPNNVKEPIWLNDKSYQAFSKKKLYLSDVFHYNQFEWFNSENGRKFLESDTKSYWPIKWTSPLLGGAG